MKPTRNDLPVGRGRPFADALTQTVGDAARRAMLLAQALAAPTGTPLAVCLLQSQGRSSLCVLDAAGKHRPEWTAALHQELGLWLQRPEADEARFTELPAEWGLAGHSLYAARLAGRDRVYGALALALDDAAPREAVLTWAAAYVGALLRLEESELAQPETVHMTAVADLARVSAHEFNNILNNITLQLAVMEQKGLPAEMRPDLAVIRQAARTAAAMVNRLQQFSQRSPAAVEAVDLNAVVQRVAVRERGAVVVTLRLESSLPRVQATERELERLVELLVESSVAALAPEAGTITLQTEASPDRVRLRLTDTGPPVSAEDLRRFFQPFAVLRRGSDGLAPALCKAIVRRLQGTIHAENQAEGGMDFTVELRPAPSGEGEGF